MRVSKHVHNRTNYNEKSKKESTLFMAFMVGIIVVTVVMIYLNHTFVHDNVQTNSLSLIRSNDAKNSFYEKEINELKTRIIELEKRAGILTEKKEKEPNSLYRQIDKYMPDEAILDIKNQRIVFVTDCTGYEQWQAYLLFHSLHKFKERYKSVTRVVHSCPSIEISNKLQQWHNQKIKKPMSASFHMIIVPQTSSPPEMQDKPEEWNYLNIPYCIHTFLQQDYVNKDDIIIYLTSDMIMLKPIDLNFYKSHNVLYTNAYKPEWPRRYNINHGTPFAQGDSSLGMMWFDHKKVLQNTSSIVYDLRIDQAQKHFSIIPPYILTVKDFQTIVPKWREYSVRLNRLLRHKCSINQAYILASADLGYKHQLIDSFLISNPTKDYQGWSYLEQTATDQLCSVASSYYTHYNNSKWLQYYNITTIPNLIQYNAGRYGLQSYFFSIRRIPSDIFGCLTPLLSVPTNSLLQNEYLLLPPISNRGTLYIPFTKLQRRIRHTIMICALTSLFNDASLFYKLSNCQSHYTQEKTLLIKDVIVQESWRYLPDIDVWNDDNEQKNETNAYLLRPDDDFPGIRELRDDDDDDDNYQGNEQEEQDDDNYEPIQQPISNVTIDKNSQAKQQQQRDKESINHNINDKSHSETIKDDENSQVMKQDIQHEHKVEYYNQKINDHDLPNINIQKESEVIQHTKKTIQLVNDNEAQENKANNEIIQNNAENGNSLNIMHIVGEPPNLDHFKRNTKDVKVNIAL